MKARSLDLREGVSRALRATTFQRRSSRWYRKQGDIVQVIELRRQERFGCHGITVALWVECIPFTWATARERVQPDAPQIHLCHFVLSAHFLDPERYEALDALALGDESAAPSEQRTLSVRLFTEEVILPFFEKASTLRGIRDLLAQGAFRSGMVHPEVRAALERIG